MPPTAIGELEHLVLLAILQLGRPAYSVEILDEMGRRGEGRVAPAAVYIALRRLENRGLVRSRKDEPSPNEGGRGRRYFQISRAGVTKVRQARQRLERLWEGLDPIFEDRS